MNAEAIRPGTVIVWQGQRSKVMANDTLDRRLFLLRDDDEWDHTLSYEPGFKFDCVDVPHVRTD